MSLEQALAANTAAVEKLVAAFGKFAAFAGHEPEPIVNTPAPEALEGGPLTPAEHADVAKQIAAPAPAKTAAKARKAEPKAEPTPPPPPSLEQAASAITGLMSQRGRPAAVAVLQKFGVAKVSELPADKFGELIEACLHALGDKESA